MYERGKNNENKKRKIVCMFLYKEEGRPMFWS